MGGTTSPQTPRMGNLSKRALAIAVVLTASFAVVGAQLLWAAPQKLLHSASASASQVLCVDDNGGSTGGSPCVNATAITTIQSAIEGALA